MRGNRALIAAIAGLFAAAFVPSEARAFCRTMTSPVPADFQPGIDTCWTKGLPLWWRNSCVGYSLQKDASRQVAYNDAADAMARAFSKWTATACPTDGTGSSRVSIDVRDLGPVNCGDVRYNSDAGNQHVIVFRDDGWPHNDANNTLALTTVVFSPDTGEIFDADMEINTTQIKVSLADPVPSEGYDFASIVTHETGHFLGMAHSGDAHATMFAHYQQGATVMRNLTSDDVAGICSVYPPDGTRVVAASVAPGGKLKGDACDPTPRHGFSTDCAAPAKKGCSIATGSGDSGGSVAPIAVAGLLLLAARARSKKTTRNLATFSSN